MKTLLIATCLSCFSVVFTYAQTDTIRDERNLIPKDKPTPPQDKDSDIVLVPQEKIPATLRQALLNDLYTGLEKSGVYQRKSTKEYSIEVRTAGGVKKYRFDEKGQPITGMGSAPNATPN